MAVCTLVMDLCSVHTNLFADVQLLSWAPKEVNQSSLEDTTGPINLGISWYFALILYVSLVLIAEFIYNALMYSVTLNTNHWALLECVAVSEKWSPSRLKKEGTWLKCKSNYSAYQVDSVHIINNTYLMSNIHNEFVVDLKMLSNSYILLTKLSSLTELVNTNKLLLLQYHLFEHLYCVFRATVTNCFESLYCNQQNPSFQTPLSLLTNAKSLQGYFPCHKASCV